MAGDIARLTLTLQPPVPNILGHSLNYYHIQYRLLSMLKPYCNINQHDLKRVDLHFVKTK